MGNSLTRGAGHACAQARISTFYSSDAWVEGRAEHQLSQVASWAGMQAVAAFPDLHLGRHGPVGAAFLADRIYPQLIGPDIGCGMALFRLDLPRRKLKIDKAVRRLACLDTPLEPEEAMACLAGTGLADPMLVHGLGTIGGGNHFCEVQAVERIFDPNKAENLGFVPDDLCLLVHTGSRNLGASVFQGIEESWAPGFDHQSAAGHEYLALHDTAMRWARLNRQVIAERAACALRAGVELICDTAHNQVTPAANGWLHRKGAAAPDQGLVPLAGSRESLSYLLSVTPDHAESLWSVSHGAGRRYDRSSMHGRVKRVKTELAAMKRNRFGGRIVCENRDLMIEEAGMAYKSSEDVARDLEGFGLAQRVVSLAPLITFKTAGEGVL